MNKHYWVPEFKYQLVEWLKKRYPDTEWNKYSKKRLYAIYFSIRDRLQLSITERI